MREVKMLSQTSLKHYEEGCPRKWEGMWMSKDIPFYANEFMDRGSYFEWLCLGGGATDNEVTDLPRKKNGDKYIHQIRIENQAEKFKKLFDKNDENYLGYDIVGNQRELYAPNKRDRGTLDFDTNKNLIWDLKLTSDALAVRHPKHWGHPAEDIDITQAIWYADLWEQNFGVRPDFWYIIFDYSTKENIILLKVSVTDENIKELNVRKQNLLDGVAVFEKEGYPEKPEKYECKSCPLKCWSRVEPFEV